MRIAVTRRIPEAGLALLKQAGDVNLWPEQLPPSRDKLLNLANGADGLLSLLTDPIDGALLDELPTVKVVSNFAVGYDNIDVPSCTERGVAVCTTPDVLTDTTADYAFALLLAAARRVVDSAISVPKGEWKTWEPLGYLGKDVAGATLGLVGLGRIGTAMAKRATGFNMEILYVDASDRPEAEHEFGAKRVDLDILLDKSDFISIHVPLLPETEKMIGAVELGKMRNGAVLVNTSRGPVVDNDALADALEAGEIWAAALDVTDPEPLPAAHRLVQLSNCIVTPHIASATEATRDKMAQLAAQNLLAVLNGDEPPRCLNPEVLKRA